MALKMKKINRPFWGKGGSNQTDATLSGCVDSPKEAIVKISER